MASAWLVIEVGLAPDGRDVRIEGLALGLDGGGQAGIHGIPEQVHGVTAHVSGVASAQIAEPVPFKAVQAGATLEVGGVVRFFGRRAEPQVPVEAGGWSAQLAMKAWW